LETCKFDGFKSRGLAAYSGQIIRGSISQASLGEHAKRKRVPKCHIIGPIASSLPICTCPPDLTQRRSASDDENVFKGFEATICQLRQATCHKLSQRSTHVATRLNGKDISHDRKYLTTPPVSCASNILCSMIFSTGMRFPAVSHIGIAPHVMSCACSICEGLALWQIRQFSLHHLPTIRVLTHGE